MGGSAKWLNLPNEEKFRNNDINCCATCNGPLPIFKDKELYIVGGGDTAMEEALSLSKFASKVIILVRSDKTKAFNIMVKKILNFYLKLYW